MSFEQPVSNSKSEFNPNQMDYSSESTNQNRFSPQSANSAFNQPTCSGSDNHFPETTEMNFHFETYFGHQYEKNPNDYDFRTENANNFHTDAATTLGHIHHLSCNLNEGSSIATIYSGELFLYKFCFPKSLSVQEALES